MVKLFFFDFRGGEIKFFLYLSHAVRMYYTYGFENLATADEATRDIMMIKNVCAHVGVGLVITAS